MKTKEYKVAIHEIVKFSCNVRESELEKELNLYAKDGYKLVDSLINSSDTKIILFFEREKEK